MFFEHLRHVISEVIEATSTIPSNSQLHLTIFYSSSSPSPPSPLLLFHSPFLLFPSLPFPLFLSSPFLFFCNNTLGLFNAVHRCMSHLFNAVHRCPGAIHRGMDNPPVTMFPEEEEFSHPHLPIAFQLMVKLFVVVVFPPSCPLEFWVLDLVQVLREGSCSFLMTAIGNKCENTLPLSPRSSLSSHETKKLQSKRSCSRFVNWDFVKPPERYECGFEETSCCLLSHC